MSSKMNQIPFLSSYEDVRAEMNRDLQYRLNSRTAQTSLGRPLYYRINVQMGVWNDLQNDTEIDVHTFRIGDFFVYATFDYAGKHARVTLGDMWQQRHNDYGDGYSNIIIHPDGRITTNWK